MGENSERGGLAILRRLLAYTDKTLDLFSVLRLVVDVRQYPQIPTFSVVQTVLIMCLARLGSLNATQQLKSSVLLKRQSEGILASADSIGRIFSLVVTDTIRRANQHLYERLKRNKSLPPPAHGLMALIVDGHESHASYRRHCAGCLKRRIKIGDGSEERTQYYHRNVTAVLIGDGYCFFLDAESQLPKEWEVACAIRLLTRILKNYPRAFDVVLADALYADASFFNFLLSHNKDILAVLKNENRDLVQHANLVFAQLPAAEYTLGGTKIQAWDATNFVSWSQVNQPVRVVATKETSRVTRQLDGKTEKLETSWMWVTTLSSLRAHTKVVIQLGHARWNIENQGFNELCNYWHSDHIYKHHPCAIINFWLMTMLAANTFHVFFHRNLKASIRKRFTKLHIARLIAGALYTDASLDYSGIPP